MNSTDTVQTPSFMESLADWIEESYQLPKSAMDTSGTIQFSLESGGYLFGIIQTEALSVGLSFLETQILFMDSECESLRVSEEDMSSLSKMMQIQGKLRLGKFVFLPAPDGDPELLLPVLQYQESLSDDPEEYQTLLLRAANHLHILIDEAVNAAPFLWRPEHLDQVDGLFFDTDSAGTA